MSSVFMVAGESSGDLHGAAVAKALLNCQMWHRRPACDSGTLTGETPVLPLTGETPVLLPSLTISGIGGPKMAQAGVALTEDVTSHAAVGLFEAVNSIRHIYDIYTKTVRLLKENKPDVLLLIDYPEFNLRLARRAKKLGIKVIYYISPQVWAWRRYRVRTIEKYVDKMLVIFPFEEDFYRRHGVEVEFVGHPLVNELKSVASRPESREALGLDTDRKVIALLPGSRRKEVESIMPALAAAARLIRQKTDEPLTLLCAKAPSVDAEAIRRSISKAGSGPDAAIRIVEDDTYRVIRAADVAVVASGTATVETMLLGTPMIVVYVMANLSYVMRPLILRVPHVAMVNIIAGEEAVPELIQWQAKPEKIAQHALRLLQPEHNKEMRGQLAEIAAKLNPVQNNGATPDTAPDVPMRVAKRVLEYVKKSVESA